MKKRIGKALVYRGDSKSVLKKMGANSVDSIVTDPPYHLTSVSSPNASKKGFMGQEWDGGDISFDPKFWRKCYRVIKPGGYLLAFAATRNYHKMAVSIEEAGFIVKDMLSWVYSSGFPKSQNVSKFIDKELGKKRKVVGGGVRGEVEKAKLYSGFGTGLKPAVEPICLAMKPLSETSYAKNVLKHGTGSLNIDGCRVGYASESDKSHQSDIARGQKNAKNGLMFGKTSKSRASTDTPTGRWPANFIHDGSGEVENVFIGFSKSSKFPVSRFFYVSKASKKERNYAGENNHPTVKPLALMRYLVRLVTPPEGKCLDPFLGSGTTGVASIIEGFKFIGIEKQEEFYKICKKRISKAVKSSGDRYKNHQKKV